MVCVWSWNLGRPRLRPRFRRGWLHCHRSADRRHRRGVACRTGQVRARHHGQGADSRLRALGLADRRGVRSIRRQREAGADESAIPRTAAATRPSEVVGPTPNADGTPCPGGSHPGRDLVPRRDDIPPGSAAYFRAHNAVADDTFILLFALGRANGDDAPRSPGHRPGLACRLDCVCESGHASAGDRRFSAPGRFSPANSHSRTARCSSGRAPDP